MGGGDAQVGKGLQRRDDNTQVEARIDRGYSLAQRGGHIVVRTKRALLATLAGIFMLVLLANLSGLVAPSAAEASVVIPLSLPELTNGAKTVVYARTVSTEARLASGHGSEAGRRNIETVVQFEVLDVVKGEANRDLTVVVPGGTVGDLTLWVDSVPQFTPGEVGLLFLDARGQVVGGHQGKMPVVDGKVEALEKPVGEVLGQVAALTGSGSATRSIAIKSPAEVANLSDSERSGSGVVQAAAFGEDFEVGLGQWTLYGNPTWGTTTYRAGTGTRSAYCAGSSFPAPGPYLDNMSAWMVAGPFDLSSAITATLEYEQYLNTEKDYDYCYAMASEDGSMFSGSGWSGSSGGLWSQKTLDLTAVPDGSGGTVNFAGDSSVWVAFYFESDGSATGEGAYVDKVELVTSTAPPTGDPVITTITPGSGSAGTGSQVTINGTGLGATQGSGRVEFLYKGSTRISAPVVSWSDIAVVCVVPTADMSGYPGSAGSGPVTVVTAAGATSNGRDFHVTFGYGGIRWLLPPVDTG